MKKLKKALSLSLALALLLALAVPALAEENEAPMSTAEGLAPVSVVLGEHTRIEQEETLYDYTHFMGFVTEEQISSYLAFKSDTKVTVSHIGSDPATVIYVYFHNYTKSTESKTLEWVEGDFKGKYLDDAAFYRSYLSNHKSTEDYIKSTVDGTGKYWNQEDGSGIDYDEETGEIIVDPAVNPILLHPGDSVTFTLPDDGSDTIYQLYTEIYYAQYQWRCWQRYNIKIDDKAVVPAGNQSAIYFTGGELFDNGVVYNYTITNHTQKPMEGCYALLTYLPERDIYDRLQAQFFQFDLNLAPGQSVSGAVNSASYGLTKQKRCWVEFDSKEERDAFFQDSNFIHIEMPDSFANQYLVSDEQTLEWLSNKLGTKLG